MIEISIRDAETSDASALLSIYAPIVTDTAVSFEIEIPTLTDFVERIKLIQKTHCWLVAIVDKQPVGYVYASNHRARSAYAYSVETAVYVHQNFHHSGIAKKLYQSLFSRLEKLDFYHAYAGISVPNDASIRLHQSVGFKPIGIFPQVGYKFGQWHSTSWWSRNIKTGSPG